MKKVILGVLMFSPVVMFAQNGQLSNVRNLIVSVGGIVNILVPIVFTLILLYFFWGLMKFVMNAGDEDARKEGKQMMIWGVVALFVASSVWGLTSFIGKAVLGTDQSNTTQNVPRVNNNL